MVSQGTGRSQETIGCCRELRALQSDPHGVAGLISLLWPCFARDRDPTSRNKAQKRAGGLCPMARRERANRTRETRARQESREHLATAAAMYREMDMRF